MEKIRLGAAATYVNGYAFKPSDWCEDGLPIIRIQDLNGTSYHLNYYEGDYPKKIEINNGDILISWSASLGIYIWDRGKALLNQHIFKVIFDKVCIDRKYFVYAVKYKLKEMESKTHGATMKHIVKKDFDNILIPYPNKKKQHEIASFLNKIDEIIEMRKQQLELLDNLIKARFVEMFGDTIINPLRWEKVVLSTVCDVRDGTHDSPEYQNKGYPLLTSKNVTSGKIDLAGCNYISQEDYDKINERSKVDKGDIIMPMIGTVGRPVIVDKEPLFAIKNVALIKFYKDTKIHNVYVKTLLESDYFDITVRNKIRGGTQKFIALGDIRKLEVLLPPFSEQVKFATFVHQIDKSKVAREYIAA